MPWATAGSLLRFAYDPDNRTFAMSATADHAVARGDWARETVIFIPARATGTVRVFYNAQLDKVETTSDGNRIAYVAPTGTGVYAVTVT